MPVPWGPHVLHTSRSRGLCASCRRATASTFPCSAERRKQRPRPCAVSTLGQVAALRMLMERGFGLLGEKGKWFGAQPSLQLGVLGSAWLRFVPITTHLLPSPWKSCSRQCQ